MCRFIISTCLKHVPDPSRALALTDTGRSKATDEETIVTLAFTADCLISITRRWVPIDASFHLDATPFLPGTYCPIPGVPQRGRNGRTIRKRGNTGRKEVPSVTVGVMGAIHRFRHCRSKQEPATSSRDLGRLCKRGQTDRTSTT